MQETIKDKFGKNHKVAIFQEVDEEDEFTARIVAEVDGEHLFCSLPFSRRDYQKSRYFSMLRSVEYFFSGNHHVTHYTGKFAYLAHERTP